MKWQPIETAPVGVVVEMGGWHSIGRRTEWRTYVSVARVRVFFFWSQKSFDAKFWGSTHWRPLPPPPKDTDE